MPVTSGVPATDLRRNSMNLRCEREMADSCWSLSRMTGPKVVMEEGIRSSSALRRGAWHLAQRLPCQICPQSEEQLLGVIHVVGADGAAPDDNRLDLVS